MSPEDCKQPGCFALQKFRRGIPGIFNVPLRLCEKYLRSSNTNTGIGAGYCRDVCSSCSSVILRRRPAVRAADATNAYVLGFLWAFPAGQPGFVTASVWKCLGGSP